MILDYGVYSVLVEDKKQNLLRCARIHLNHKQIEIIELAIEVAGHAHFTQKRKTGEPYIIHPIEVATIVCEWGLDEVAIAGALLHDTIEDTAVTKADIIQIFGPTVAELVDAVTKLDKLSYANEQIAHAEYFRKIVLAMANDVRVILIKIADRLHNMFTLASMAPEKRKRIARETMEIYVPLANKIGLYKAHLQLADESFKYLNPYRYQVLFKAVTEAQKKRRPIIEEILQNIGNSLKSNGISGQFVYREKGIYNLYLSMRERGQNFNRVYDVFEIKIVVKKISECYLTVGVLHSLYQPLPGTFKDFIAIPKSNGYQSLHSTLMGPNGIPLQIHIRTLPMDEVAETGIISHWLKQQLNNDEYFSAHQRTTNLINNILDIQSSTFSANEFMDSLKQDFSPGDMYVFTPKSRIVLLPNGSTVLDFAYFIHSDIGNHCHHAIVNQEIVKPDFKLRSGDIVEIVTANNIEPTEEWLSMVVSGKAISKIKQFFKEQKFDEDIEKGKNLINLVLANFTPIKKITNKDFDNIIKKYYPQIANREELKHEVGAGNIPALEVSKLLLGHPKDATLMIDLDHWKMPILQDNSCLALPGEPILAKINRQDELVFHRHNCKEIRKIGLENFTNILIINNTSKTFASRIQVVVPNEPGIFSKLTNIIGKRNINILEISQPNDTGKIAYIYATLSVHDLNEIEELITVLQHKNFILNAMLV
jgi:guanosine-3',5'-bis(diphosphate) 3'-pyrophosphohydrolase